ncbi:TauD/TfdA dioxygenase family protein [Skermanella aerolata]|nr:TauD/TfdA family dioxygenase [Skermanella aerolata]
MRCSRWIVPIGASLLPDCRFTAPARHGPEVRGTGAVDGAAPRSVNQLHYHDQFSRVFVLQEGKPIGLADASRYGHSDLSYLREPSLGSLLHAQELPEQEGDTLFATMFGAYDSLPEDLRDRIDGLQAVHDYGSRNRKQQAASALRPELTAPSAPDVVPDDPTRRRSGGRSAMIRDRR